MTRPTLFVLTAMFAAILSAGPAAAQNNGLPTRAQSVILMNFIADKGLECGLARPWQAALIEAMVLQETLQFDAGQRAEMAALAAERSAEADCDNGMLTAYLDAALPNLEAEGLSNYLVIYRAFAEMETRPAVFEHIALRDDYAPAVAAIGEKLAALEASGAVPDGGGSWDAFIAGTAEAAGELAGMLTGENPDARYSPDEAAALIAQTALIVELWLEDAPAAD